MYKNILVPVDLVHEDVALRIIRKAHSLLKDEGKITLLHVIDEVPTYATGYLPEGTIETNIANVKSALSSISQMSDSETKSIVRFGKAAPIILEEAKNTEADLIVMASHNPGLIDYLIGSTSSRVVHHAKCSVLVDRHS